jgi:hypothetical protein
MVVGTMVLSPLNGAGNVFPGRAHRGELELVEKAMQQVLNAIY